MGDKPSSPEASSAVATTAVAAMPQPAPTRSRRAMTWQLPALVFGLCLIALGLYALSGRRPVDDFDGALDQVEALQAHGQFDDAAQVLRERIERNIVRATASQTARFHLLLADQLFRDARRLSAGRQAWSKVAEQYAAAVEQGVTLTPERIERRAEALIEAGDLVAARAQLASLKALRLSTGASGEVERETAGLLRRIVAASIEQPETSAQAAMQLLSEYRSASALAPADEAWAAARQAEIRLLQGHAQDAVNRLLIDVRRIEQRSDGMESAPLGELLLLLGRAQHEIGAGDDARYSLELALRLLTPGESLRGEAIELLGRIALSDGELEEALEHFDTVVRDSIGTRAHLPALLGAAEVRGMLGEHDQSLADFQTLRDLLVSTVSGQQQGHMRDRLAAALVDRHDAALASGNLDLALQYLKVADNCYPASGVPLEIVHRMATTSRQLADDLAAEALEPREAGEAQSEPAPDIAEAMALYRQAADSFVKHARALAPQAGADLVWADSLWLASDSYERANWTELALQHFSEYLASAPRTDPRRAEAMFRIAQAHHAMGELDKAVEFYERIIQENPRSPLAAQSHSPLARCYVALNRRGEAELQLVQVLDGQLLLSPSAADYRDAQFQLGALYFEGGDYIRAIETLDGAITANPADDRVDEARLQLAESYLKHALSADESLAVPDQRMTRRNEVEQLQREYLSLSLDLYAEAIEAMESRRGRLDPLQLDALRAAYMARADAAFHLGRFDQASYELAADYYDQTARRYSEQSVSLTALVQVVNCFYALGDRERAHAAQLRAQARLEQLPDSAFDAPDAILDRQAWERWLRNAPPLPRNARADADPM